MDLVKISDLVKRAVKPVRWQGKSRYLGSVFRMNPWYEASWLWLVVMGVAGLGSLAIVWIVWRHRTSPRNQMLATLRNISDRLLRNVMLPDSLGGHIGADAVMLRDGRIYVLSIHDADGAIFGGEKMDRWTAIGRHRRDTFRNPLRIMQERVAAVQALVPEFTIAPRVLFTARGHFPKGRPEGVELLEEFAAPLRRRKSMAPVALDPEREGAWIRLQQAAGVPAGKELPSTDALGSAIPGAPGAVVRTVPPGGAVQ